MHASSRGSNPRFSLIFVNFRSARYLARALESLFSSESTKGRFEVIVVNNDVRESRVIGALARVFGFRVVENGENLGFGAAVNRGVGEARGQVCGFLNPDIRWPGAQLAALEAIFAHEAPLGAVGLRLVDTEGRTDPESAGAEVNLLAVLKNNAPSFVVATASEAQALAAFDWVSGGALFVTREAFEAAGGFDERFFLYFEDVDFCQRLRQLGFRVVRAETVSVIHYGGKSQVSRASQKQAFYASQSAYFRKHRPAFEYGALRILRFLRYGF